MTSSKTEKAPTLAGDALSTIEDALVRAVVDAKIEIDRRFPRGKTPTYTKRWRELARLLQKQRQYDQALALVDGLKKQPATLPHDPARQDRAPQAPPRTNGGAHHDAAIAASPF